MDEIGRNKIGKIFLKTKRRSKKIKLKPSKTQHFKAIKKFLIFESLWGNKIYLHTLSTYSVGDSKFDAIKSKENPTTFDMFAIEESEDHKSLIEYLSQSANNKRVTKILNEAHTVIKPFELPKYIRLHSRYS